jgi:hypothetical protein
MSANGSHMVLQLAMLTEVLRGFHQSPKKDLRS